MQIVNQKPSFPFFEWLIFSGIGNEIQVFESKEKRTGLSIQFLPQILATVPENKEKLPKKIELFLQPQGGIQLFSEHQNPYNHEFVLTHEDGSQLYGFAFSRFFIFSKKKHSNLQQLFNHRNLGKLPPNIFASRTIAVVTRWPFHRTYEIILRRLLIGVKKFNQKTIQKLADALNQIPQPNTWASSSKIFIDNHKIYLPIVHSKQLPTADLSFSVLFSCLDPSNVIDLFTAILLERQTVFISNNASKITTCTETIRSLLYPFEWLYPYIPILPPTFSGFLDAPTPFIFGGNNKILEKIELSSQIIVAYLDINLILINEPITPLPERLKDRLIKLILKHANVFTYSNKRERKNVDSKQRYSEIEKSETEFLCTSFSSESSEDESDEQPKAKRWDEKQQEKRFRSSSTFRIVHKNIIEKPVKLAQNLENISTEESEETDHNFMNRIGFSSKPTMARFVIPEEVEEKEPEINVKELRKGFMKIFVSLLKKYPEYMIFPTKEKPSNFKAEEFLKIAPEDSRTFLNKLVETQLFSCFIDNQLIGDSKERYFNEIIIEKMKRRSLRYILLRDAQKTEFLVKRGKRRKNWKKRFFHLNQNELRYYQRNENQEKKQKLKGVINLVQGETKIQIPKNGPRNFMFQIVTKKRTYSISCESEISRREWVAVLKSRCFSQSEFKNWQTRLGSTSLSKQILMNSTVGKQRQMRNSLSQKMDEIHPVTISLGSLKSTPQQTPKQTPRHSPRHSPKYSPIQSPLSPFSNPNDLENTKPNSKKSDDPNQKEKETEKEKGKDQETQELLDKISEFFDKK
ncbi:c-myc promoter binding protein [Anaeramoeba ignava]|uniref:C-myc promoter binding protein n=1 Tax=Anaeramoeba ignava TaxID=1746090 RepID=A0A9Q0LFM0_ANAIG|nr:c-myc promoter binding protein [Anaeramoeba ignava]